MFGAAACRSALNQGTLAMAQCAELQHRALMPEDFTILEALDTTTPREGADLREVQALVARADRVQCEELCDICVNSTKTHRLPCGHLFCGDCLERAWGSVDASGGRCPQCREDVAPLLAMNAARATEVDQEGDGAESVASGPPSPGKAEEGGDADDARSQGPEAQAVDYGTQTVAALRKMLKARRGLDRWKESRSGGEADRARRVSPCVAKQERAPRANRTRGRLCQPDIRRTSQAA